MEALCPVATLGKPFAIFHREGGEEGGQGGEEDSLNLRSARITARLCRGPPGCGQLHVMVGGENALLASCQRIRRIAILDRDKGVVVPIVIDIVAFTVFVPIVVVIVV